MATVIIFAPELTGETGLTMQIRTLAGVAVNSPIDSLTESPSGSGRFTANVTETIPSEITHVAVFDSTGQSLREGWIPSGETFVQDSYPSSGGSNGDPLTNPVPGSYAEGTAGYKLGLIGANASSVYAPPEVVTKTIYQTKTTTLTFNTSEDFTGYTATLSIKHRVTGATLLTKTITVTSSTLLTANLSATDTAFATLVDDDEFGPHPYEIRLVSGATERALPRGIVFIYKDLS